MIAKDGDLTISFVICIQLFLEGCIFQGVFVQQSLERYGGVVRTENLCSKTFHFGLEMFIQSGRLDRKVRL